MTANGLMVRAHWYALGRIEEATSMTSGGGTNAKPEDRPAEFALWASKSWASQSPTDSRTMHDRWLQFIHGSRHWHVPRYASDDDVYVTYSVAEALDYAATELERIAESEDEDATSLAEAGEFEEAWKSHANALQRHGLVANLRNVSAQHAAEPADRAPLYQDPETAPERLRVALDHVIVDVRAEGPFGFNVYDCRHDECRPRPDGEEDWAP